MSKTIQAVRGMNDCLPANSPLWQKLEATIKKIVANYGYNEMRMPIVEATSLFSRAIGEVTDVVEKEMYTFTDRNGDSLTLRPEGTAGCVRAGIENGLLYNQEQRIWYIGPMFRHERPQKGRYRQFHQFGLEVFGIETADIDAEVIMLTSRLWRELGIENHVTLELNSIGSNQARATYRTALIAFLEQHIDTLDEDSKRRMYSNPLRVLDTKNEAVQKILLNAPKLSEYLDEGSKQHFSNLCQYLDQMGIKYQINERLVRGLDYYNRTVFEWVTNSLGAQGTMCGGGRYDSLVEQLGGKPTHAVGFAMGLERLVLMLETLGLAGDDTGIDVYILSSNDEALIVGLKVAEMLRNEITNIKVMNHFGGGNFKKQFKRADKLNATLALVIGENEIQNNTLVCKNLTTGIQDEISLEQVAVKVKELI